MKKYRKARWKHKLEDAAVAVIIAMLWPLGYKGAQRFGSFLGSVWFYVYKRRIDVAGANIRRALGEGMSDEEVSELILKSYQNLGKTFLEFARFPYMKAEDASKLVRWERWEVFEEVLAAGKGGVLVAGHYGNWELFGAAAAGRGLPISFLVGRQHNAIVDKRINGYRARMGVGIIRRGAAVREIPRAMERNKFVAILADQDAHRQGVFVNFLGTPASTPRGPAHFSYHTGAPILFGSIERLEDGTHLSRMTEPIWPRTDADEEEEIQRLTQAFTDHLADAVRRRPDQYFWPHRRWKTAPPELVSRTGEER